MSGERLTKAQRSMLQFIVANGVTYASPNDVCLNALARKGMARFRKNVSRYGRDCWHVTDAGRAALTKEGGR